MFVCRLISACAHYTLRAKRSSFVMVAFASAIAFTGCQVQVAFGPNSALPNQNIATATQAPAEQVPNTARPTIIRSAKMAHARPARRSPIQATTRWQPTEAVANATQVAEPQYSASNPQHTVQTSVIQTVGYEPSGIQSQAKSVVSQASATIIHEPRELPIPLVAGIPEPEKAEVNPGGVAPTFELDAGLDASNAYPINLVTALQLAGAESWDIQLATERVREAYARLDQADVLWLPSLVGGVGYTKHEGQIQGTNGQILDIGRNAFFVGGGPALGGAPITGAAGGPARLAVDLSLADAIFKPLVAQQEVNAEHFRQSADTNTTLLTASLAYFELMRAQGRLANANANLKNAQELMKLTEAFVSSGKGSRADIARVRTERSKRKQLVMQAVAGQKAASAELARIIRIDPATTLFSLEESVVPIELIGQDNGLDELVALGLRQRPELAESQNRLHADWKRVCAERWRPFIPNLSVGASAGGFGGGTNDVADGLSSRTDFDVAAVWQVKNLGFGAKADIDISESAYRQTELKNYRLQDVITTEITRTFHQLAAQRQRIDLARANVEDARDSLKLNNLRIKGLAGLPLEALQSVDAVATSNRDYLDAIIDHNQSQVRLMRATGYALEPKE
jgi:outer membrane protein TolC